MTRSSSTSQTKDFASWTSSNRSTTLERHNPFTGEDDSTPLLNNSPTPPEEMEPEKSSQENCQCALSSTNRTQLTNEMEEDQPPASSAKDIVSDVRNTSFGKGDMATGSSQPESDSSPKAKKSLIDSDISTVSNGNAGTGDGPTVVDPMEVESSQPGAIEPEIFFYAEELEKGAAGNKDG